MQPPLPGSRTAAQPGPAPAPTPPPLQAFTDQDWQRHLTWRRYIPEPSVSGVVALTLAPVWMWSVLVSLALGLYATYAEVGCRGGLPVRAGVPGSARQARPRLAGCLAAGVLRSIAGCLPRGGRFTRG